MDSNKVERAVAKMSDPISTPEELIAASEKHIPAIKANTAISPEVTTAADQWNTSHLAYVASNKKVVDADVAAAKARTERATAERDLLGRARGCLLAITVEYSVKLAHEYLRAGGNAMRKQSGQAPHIAQDPERTPRRRHTEAL